MPANINPRRSESVAKSSASTLGALVERARILTVNIRDYTVDVATEFTHKPKFDIPFMTPYCHQNQGEGVSFMPEVGATCWICSPSEEGRESFVLGFTMVDEGGSYRGGRDLLNPGDLNFKTRDGNFVTLRRGGIVQIGSTPICQRVFLPIRNIIQDYAENYELHTPAGDMTWEVSRKEDDSDGHQACLFTLSAKEFSDDPNAKPLAILKVGSHGEGNPTILSLLTRDRGGGSTATSLEINKSGDLNWSVKRLKLSVSGNADLAVDGLFKLAVLGAVDISSLANISASAPSISLVAGASGLQLGGAGASLKGPAVGLGDAMYPVVRASPDFLAWVGAVSALLIGPPGPPQTVMTVGPALIPPVLHISTKVKA
jgi:hypothetical protein